jgi:hypothetical protein
VPVWGRHVNPDIKAFIRYFLPKGAPATAGNISKAVRHLHLAFKGKTTAEIYDILMEQLLRAIKKYDPAYTDKVRLVAEVINAVDTDWTRSRSLSSTTIWGLIVIAVCACSATVVFLKRSSERVKKNGSWGGRGPVSGLRPNPSLRPMPLGMAGMLAVRSAAGSWSSGHSQFAELIEVVGRCLRQLK